MRIFLRINFGLGFSSFSLGNHISYCKGVFGGVDISFTLCLLLPLPLYLLFCQRGHNIPFFLFLSPYWYFGTRRRFLGGERSVGGGGGGGGITGGSVLGASFELPPLFLLASRPFRPGRFFWSICSSSSSDSEST